MTKARFSQKVEQALNTQMTYEAEAAQFYLAMGSWAEVQGYDGVASFLYAHAAEERDHMIKFVAFINQRGGHCKIEALSAPGDDPKSLEELFDRILQQETENSNRINDIVDICLKEKDHSTNNFLLWFVKEQIEEEALATKLVDQLRLIGEDAGNRGGLYEFDRNVASLHAAPVVGEAG